MEFRVLGPVEVGDGLQALTPARAQERRLLAVLLASANQTVSADRVAEALWPAGAMPAHAHRAVQTHVSRLRAALGPAGERLGTRPPGYVLRVLPGELDAHRFERLLEEARRLARETPDRALSLLDEALGLWRGSPYGELRDEDFATGDAVRLEELRLVAIEERFDARLALGHHAEVVGELEARCAEHPLRERLRRSLMIALYRSGRHAEALRAFDQYRRGLAEELGLDPSPDLRAVEAQVLAHDPGLAGPPAPSAGLPLPVGPLATPVTSFVGRSRDLADLSRRLETARLVTITGPGGVGKTRLATHLAATVADQFADGVAVCELAAVADADAVAGAVAAVLGIQPRPDRSVEASVAAVLRTKRALLVIDNCEHVVDAAAAVLAAVVETCPRVTVLATSRERLAISGEQVWPLAPLSLEAAVDLFCDRARSVRPDLDCAGEERDFIVDICRRMDGLPLGIELAAAHLATMNPADLAHGLEDRLLLDRGRRGAPRRHRSLRSVADWSYGRLDLHQRRLFDRLSVFAGSFTADAAEHVCAGDGVERAALRNVLADLVEGSLVTLAGGGGLARYRLLETLRAYGRERLEASGGGGPWEARHASFYVELARRADRGLRGRDEGAWVRRLEAEIDNLRAAHRWAIDQDDAGQALELSHALHGYAHRSMRPELFSWAERAARLPGAAGHRLLPLVLGSAATGAWMRGDLAGAQRLAEEALAAAGGALEGHLGLQAASLVAFSTGDLATARALELRAAEAADAYGDHYEAVINRLTAVLALAYDGRTPDAVEEAEGVLAAARRLDCPSATAWASYLLGEVLLDDDPARALPLLDESHASAAGVGSVFLTGLAAMSATTLRARQDDAGAAEALDRFPDLIDRWERAGNWTQQWTMLRSLIATLVRVGRDEPAAVLYGAMEASPTAAPVFGADRERLAAALAAIEKRAGRPQLEAWMEQGRRVRAEDVAALARAAARHEG